MLATSWMDTADKIWATLCLLWPCTCKSTWGKFSCSPTRQGKCLNFPACFLLPARATEGFPSVMQSCLGRFQRAVSLAPSSGRYSGFPCSTAPAAIPSPVREQHSFLLTPCVMAEPGTPWQPRWAAPLSFHRGSQRPPYACVWSAVRPWPGDWTSAAQGWRACCPNVTLLPSSACGMQKGVVQTEQDWALQKTNTVGRVRQGANQQDREPCWALPASHIHLKKWFCSTRLQGCGSASTGRTWAHYEHVMIWTNAFFSPNFLFFISPGLFPPPCFHKLAKQWEGLCPTEPEAAASRGWRWAEEHPCGFACCSQYRGSVSHITQHLGVLP